MSWLSVCGVCESGWMDASLWPSASVRVCVNMWMSDKTPFIDRTCTQQGRTLDTMQPSAVEQQGSVDASLMLSPQAFIGPDVLTVKKKKQTSKWVPVFSSFWSTVCAFQNKPNQGNTSGKSGWTYPSTAIKRWKQSVYINDEHGLVTLIRGDDNFKSVNFGEEAERGECPGKIWRICIMWVCPLLQKSFMPPKGFLGALRHHTEGRQAGRADSKWFLCKTAAALHHHAPFATMTRIICAPCKARRGPRRSSTLWTGPKHSESTPPPPPPKKNTHAKEK